MNRSFPLAGLLAACFASTLAAQNGSAPLANRLKVLPEVRHAFTHLKAVYRPMLVFGARLCESDDIVVEECQWVSPDQVERLPLPVAQRKILELAKIALAAPAPTAPASTC